MRLAVVSLYYEHFFWAMRCVWNSQSDFLPCGVERLVDAMTLDTSVNE